MKLPEKVSYLQGLMDGMEIDVNTKEGKLFKAIADILDDVAIQIEDLEDSVEELSEAVDEIDEDLGELESDVYDCDCCDDEDDEDDDEMDDDFDEIEAVFETDADFDDTLIPVYSGDGEAVFEVEKGADAIIEELTDGDADADSFIDTVDEEEDAEDGDDLPEEELYEVVCPTCNDSIYLTEKMLAAGSINCPVCGELLEFDMSEEE